MPVPVLKLGRARSCAQARDARSCAQARNARSCAQARTCRSCAHGEKVTVLILLQAEGPLTSDPVEVELSIVGFFFRSQGLQGQLELLSMQ